MRDILIFALIFGALPFCIYRPYYGILLWSVLAYMNPHKLTFGAAFNFPFAQFVAIATLLGIFLMYSREKKFPAIIWERETVLISLLWVMFTITTVFANLQGDAWQEWERITKIFLMTFLTIMLVKTEKQLRYLILIIAFSFGFYGFKAGIFSVLTSSQYRVWGPEGTFLADNNALGLALTMSLPLFVYLAMSEKIVWLKSLFLATFAFTIVSVILTYSRGAFLGLAVVLLLIFLRLSFAKKTIAVIALFILLPTLISYIPDQWINRIDTLQTYEEDGSAQSRFEAWRAAWKIAVAHPLAGGGFQILNDPDEVRKYDPEFTESGVGAHSTYFEVIGENGFITFAIFMTLLFSAILSARHIRKLAKKNNKMNYYYYGLMFETSLFAYAISGAFLEVASYDLFYHIIAIIVVLKVMLRNDLNNTQNSTKEDAQSIVKASAS